MGLKATSRIRDSTLMLGAALAAAALLAGRAGSAADLPPPDAAERQLAHDVFQQLVEINTTDSVGNTTVAAQAMADRLLAAGFPPADVVVLGPNPRKGNLVARYRGAPDSGLRPILIIAHLDVVEARREDWTTDPFQFIEKGGFYYGRGTQDMKDSVAIAVADFVRLKRERYVPDRDIILALTADEEAGQSNGVAWLLANHPDLIAADYVLNPDSGGVWTEGGKPVAVEIEATEKLYADFVLSATNAGGHSSLPRPDNAIYHVADALTKLERNPFPVELNPVTREYLARMADVAAPQMRADLQAALATVPDPAAIARLSADAHYNATLRTTCVATLVSGGHAPNALPQRAEANVNCRILPGHSAEDVRLYLERLFDDPQLKVGYRSETEGLSDQAPATKAMPPPPPYPVLMAALTGIAARTWPGAAVIPIMETGASDSIHTMSAGIPSYGINGIAIERDDVRAHGRDERVGVESFYVGLQFYYEFLVALTTQHP
jgi:acetylornithine deacetylase/succinyl-diaminopimelate desuccinylase-like protein